MPDEGKQNNFDFLRLTLAVLVIYSHSYPLGTGSELNEPVRRLTHGQLTGGAIAVDLFFVMSGFLIAASAERSSSVGSFLKKRFLRIYPAFIVCAIIAAACVLPASGGSFAAQGSVARIADFVWSTARLHEFHYIGAFSSNPYPHAINGSTWSIPYEFWCYIGVALLLVAGALRRRSLILIAFILSLAISVAFVVRGWIFGGMILGRIFGSPQLWARLLPLYLAGVVFYLYREKIALRAWGAALALCALLAACFVPWGMSLVFPLAGTYLVFCVAFSSRFRMYSFGRFGDFSYGAYLYAYPVQQLLMRGFGHEVAPWRLFLLATPITLVAAVLSWYGVERYFLGSRRPEAHRIPKADAPAIVPIQAVTATAGSTEA